MGLWLPLALADLMAALVASVRLMAKNPNEVKVPKRSDTLASWCLPMMSRAIAADEKEREALALFKSVESLKRKVES